MKKNTKHIDELLREELGAYSEIPPATAWEALEQKLAGTPAPVRRRPHIGYIVGLLCFLAISLSIGKKWMGAGNSGTHVQGTEQTLPDNSQNVTPTTENQSVSAPASQPKTAENDHSEVTAHNLNSSNTPDNNEPGSNNLTGNKAMRHGNKRTRHNPAGDASVSNPASHAHSRLAHNSRHASKKRHKIIPENRFSSTETSDAEAFAGPSGNSAPQSEPSADHLADSLPGKSPAASDNKKLPVASKPAPAYKKEPTRENKLRIPRFEAGIKTGYERGFDNEAAQKWTISPYLQYNFSEHLSLMLQPAFKFASLAPVNIGKSSTYYKQNKDSTVKQVTDSVPVIIFDGNNDKVWVWHDIYSQTHDSIIKAHNLGGQYTEMELPILLKYRVAKWFSVYGGLNMVYSRSVSVNEFTYTKNNILRTDSTFIQFGPVGGAAPAPEFSTSTILTYNGNEISSYKNPYLVSTATSLRFGYMLGFTCSYKSRWLFDGLVEQTPTAANVQGGYNINNTLSALYFRLSLGYKLTH